MSIFTNTLKIFRMTRMLMKCTHPLSIAVCLFAVGLSYSLYLKNDQLAERNAQLRTDNQQLKQQIASEQQAWQVVEQQRIEQHKRSAQRHHRLREVIKKPSVAASANDVVAPVISHALNEFRREQKK